MQELRGEKQYRLVEPLLNLYGLENSKPTANPGRRSTVMELASAIPLDGHDYFNFRTAVGKLIFMAPWRPDMQFAIRQLSTQVVNPTTESKRAVKQLIQYLKGTQHTSLRLEPRGMVQKGLLELVGRIDSDWAGDSATRQSVTEISLQCAGRDDVQQKSEADSNQSQFMRGRVLRFQCLRRRTSGTRRSLQGTAPQPSSSSRDGFRSRTTHSTAQRTRRTQAYRKTMLGCTTVDMRKNVSRWVEWTRRTTLQVSSRNIWMDRERSRSQGNLDFESWKARMTTGSF